MSLNNTNLWFKKHDSHHNAQSNSNTDEVCIILVIYPAGYEKQFRHTVRNIKLCFVLQTCSFKHPVIHVVSSE